MNVEALYHRHKQSWAYAYNSHAIVLRLRTMRNDIQAVTVHYGDKYKWPATEQTVPMRKGVPDARFDYWEAEVEPINGRLSYRFCVVDGDEQIFYGERWCEAAVPEESFGNFEYPYLSEADRIRPPEWVKDAVFYQIFPERFANGDRANDPPLVEPWGAVPTKQNYFGGDLQGVIDKLDHLTALGVNAIYFTPVFLADSSHKYDTRDYYRIDPHFGSNETMKTLVEACHERGIRVMLDIVFNHCGTGFAPFQDVLEKGRASAYADWFLLRDQEEAAKGKGLNYETFGYEESLPKFNLANEEVCAYLLDVAAYWLKTTDVDGFRLDVANEVDHRFWRKFREVVKAIKPEAYLLGEIFHDAMAWLQGDQLDAVMNYPIRDSALKFFGSQIFDSKQFADHIGEQLAFYPRQVNEASFHLQGSHDTPRLHTLCGGDERKARLAALFQFTYFGAPCIYYGDEIGIDGENDPDNRKCMVWEREAQNLELFAYYRSLIELRLAHQALRTGELQIVHAASGDRRLAYVRRLGTERLLVVMNAQQTSCELALAVADAEQASARQTPAVLLASDGAEVRVAGEQLHELHVQLPPYGYLVLDIY